MTLSVMRARARVRRQQPDALRLLAPCSGACPAQSCAHLPVGVRACV